MTIHLLSARAARVRAGIAAWLLAAAGAAHPACDLRAVFVSPAGSPLPGGAALQWKLQFGNLGSAACPANSVRLQRFAGTSATGSASFVGGSGQIKALPALAAGAAVDLTFDDAATPDSGTYTLKPAYQSPHNDADNTNHHPTRMVSFQPPAVAALPDLVVTGVSFVGPPRVGSCNTVRLTVRNNGASVDDVTLGLVAVFPSKEPMGSQRFEKTVPFGTIAATRSVTREINGMRIASAGGWRLFGYADHGNKVAETNDLNNAGLSPVVQVSATCS